MTQVLFFSAVFAIALVGIALFRRWAEKRSFLDVPNDRSSHRTPTPRGGGAVIVAVCLVSYLLIAYFYPTSFSWGYFGGAMLVAAVSWLDDVYSLWFVWRFFAHSIAAVVLILDVGYWHAAYVPFAQTYMDIGWPGAIVTFLWVTWLVNAYNFMDGIDGIAGTQAVIAGFGWFLLSYQFDIPAIACFAGAVAVASLAFLFHNWQPAKIFMGDVGSAFLGFTFAALPLLARKAAINAADIFATAAVVFLWFFIFDTVVTFFHRLSKRRNVFSAHREHIYQRLVISGMSHSKVTLVYGVLTLLLASSMFVSVATARRAEITVMVMAGLTATLMIIHFVTYKRSNFGR